MREYLAKYNKTDEQKVARLITQKNNTDLTAQIKLILKPDGFFPLHVDILNEEFQQLNPKRKDRIYFIQDVNDITEEDLQTVVIDSDQVIWDAINLLNDPRIQQVLEQYEQEHNEESQSK